MAYDIRPTSNALKAEPALYLSALTDGAGPLSLLGSAALEAIDSGVVEPLEGLAIAGLFYRMAAERERPDMGIAHVDHAEVMLRRERLDREAGNDEMAVIAGAFALRALNRAADAGNESASDRLIEVASHLLQGAHEAAQDWARSEGAAEQAHYDAILRQAAEGDAAALGTVMDEVIADQAAGALDFVQMLAICEQVGRLGAAAGHDALAVRLCGALLCRAHHERSNGKTALATEKEVEGIGVVAVAMQNQHPGAGDLLTSIVDVVERASLARAACVNSTVLSAMPAQGAS